MISRRIRCVLQVLASACVFSVTAIGLPALAAQAHDHSGHAKKASEHAAHQHGDHAQHSGESSAEATGWTLAEVRKVDLEQGRLTLRHERIESLDMEPMTMVFRVAEAVSLDGLGEGAKVRFQVERQQGRLVITALEPTP